MKSGERSSRIPTRESSLPPQPDLQGSRRVLTWLLRSLAQGMEGWADRLETAITGVKATLPDPRVRHDWLADLWRLWLKIGASLRGRFPDPWGDVVVTLLPVLSLLLCGTIVLGHWVTPVSETTPEAPLGISDTSPLPNAWLGDQAFPDSAPEIEDRSPQDPPADVPESAPEDEIAPEPPSPFLDPAPEPDPPPEPFGPRTPSHWSRWDPLWATLEAQLQDGLKSAEAHFIELKAVDLDHRRLTVVLKDGWADLNPQAQRQLANHLNHRSHQLDFPQLYLQTPRGDVIARSAIVGENLVFLQPTP